MMSTYTKAQHCAIALGVLAACGALAILWQEPISTGVWTMKHFLLPILITIAIVTGELAVVAASEHRLGSAAGFAFVFVVSSALTLYSSVGSQKEKSAEKASGAEAHNELLADKRAALKGEEHARDVAGRLLEDTRAQLQADCVRGKKSKAHCDGVRTNIGVYEAAIAGHETVIARYEADIQKLGGKKVARPNAEALGELATVLGWNGTKVAAVATVAEPFAFSFCFEIASIVAFLYGLRSKHMPATVAPTATVPEPLPPKPGNRRPVAVNQVTTKAAAEADIVQLVARGQRLPNQEALRQRWRVHKGTASKWLRDFEQRGLVQRDVEGRCKTVRSAMI
ncbi:MAG: hypothetical protein NW223_23660 [Hyphomicrobiaceae bacterium]|nr:hypothetical protein [Hyphomicrobiaceae bacterium]